MTWEQSVVTDFVCGKSIADIAVLCCCHRLSVEQAIREAVQQLVQKVAAATVATTDVSGNVITGA